VERRGESRGEKGTRTMLTSLARQPSHFGATLAELGVRVSYFGCSCCVC
jgi:hypothetical protein